MTPWIVFALLALAAASPVPQSPAGVVNAPLGPPERPLGLPVGIDSVLLPPLHGDLQGGRRLPAPAGVRAGDDPYRLPTTIKPIYYTLFLSVDMEALEFMGTVTIKVTAEEETSSIVLHAGSNLVFEQDNVSVMEDKAGAVTIQKIERDPTYQTLSIQLSSPLKKDTVYTLKIEQFSSELNTKLNGFYRSSYKEKGETRYLATTQFEPTHAREAFPCFDEPSLKARFSIQIGHDKNFVARSNMPGATQLNSRAAVTDDVEAIITQFDETPVMSTYLLAWVVSDFESLSNGYNTFSTWARRDIVQGGGLSQSTGQAALKLLGQYTGIPFELPKVDQFAIPDFSAGAMENWGLVTYREPYLIVTKDTDVRYEQQIQTVICHELGHQWTGNLVTLDWWSHTWLNEGFATFFENFICDQINPGLHLIDKMLATYTHVAMDVDLIPGQHAMSSPVSTYDEIETKFDRISYAKGGSVLRMFQHILSPPVFQKGLQDYLSKSAHGNADPTKLFDAMSDAAIAASIQLPASFNVVAESWTEQPGVPLVNVTWDPVAMELTVTQKRLTASVSDERPEGKWYVPVSVVTSQQPDSSQTAPSTWLTPTATSAKIKLPEGTQWVVVNPQQTGYYRVLYDGISRQQLSSAIVAQGMEQGKEVIPPATRSQFLGDILALARTGDLDWITPVMNLELLGYESQASVWMTGVKMISELQDHLANTDVYPNFQTLLNSFTGERFAELGLTVGESDSHNDRHVRYYVAPYACESGNRDCLRSARQLLSDWLKQPELVKLHPDTAATIRCYGMKGADQTVFKSVTDLLDKSSSGSEMARHAQMLSCSDNTAGIKMLLDDALLSSNKDRILLLFNNLNTRIDHHKLVFEFLQKSWSAIDKVFGDADKATAEAPSQLVGLLTMWIQTIRSDTEYKTVNQWVQATFAARKDYAQLTKALENTDSLLAAWYRKNYSPVASTIYFLTQGMTTESDGTTTSSSSSSSSTSSTQPPTQPPTDATTPAPTPKPSAASTPAMCSALLVAALAYLALY